MARELFHHFHGKTVQKCEHNVEDKGYVSARVMEIARSALKMTDVDLEDFFGEDQQVTLSVMIIIVLFDTKACHRLNLMSLKD